MDSAIDAGSLHALGRLHARWLAEARKYRKESMLRKGTMLEHMHATRALMLERCAHEMEAAGMGPTVLLTDCGHPEASK